MCYAIFAGLKKSLPYLYNWTGMCLYLDPILPGCTGAPHCPQLSTPHSYTQTLCVCLFISVTSNKCKYLECGCSYLNKGGGDYCSNLVIYVILNDKLMYNTPNFNKHNYLFFCKSNLFVKRINIETIKIYLKCPKLVVKE